MNFQDAATRMTPLLVCCTQGDADIVRLLLRSGADVGLRDKRGNLPLHYAAEGGFTELLALLLDHQNNVIPVEPSLRSSALHLAASNGHVESCRLNATNAMGQLPLDLVSRAADKASLLQASLDQESVYRACEEGDIALLNTLLDTPGFDVNSVNSQGASGLCVACDGGRPEVVERLLEAGADANVKGQYDRTPLHLACAHGTLAAVCPTRSRSSCTRCRCPSVDSSAPRGGRRLPGHHAGVVCSLR